ncbi:hypothetical protein GH891_33475, partial [Bacillus thuringiensis]|nr:hypothetical protein [Bacillus thuringiensis]
PKTDKREKKVHFVFDAIISNFDDLWVESKVKQKIWRVYPDDENTIETTEDTESQPELEKRAPEKKKHVKTVDTSEETGTDSPQE